MVASAYNAFARASSSSTNGATLMSGAERTGSEWVHNPRSNRSNDMRPSEELAEEASLPLANEFMSTWPLNRVTTSDSTCLGISSTAVPTEHCG
jgi:hypothetical protein